MITGTHIVVASKDPQADYDFFRGVLGLSSVDAGEGYIIFGLPESEASIHQTDGNVPHHELYFLTDDITSFVNEMKSRNIACGEVTDQGWGVVVQVTMPSGAPLQVYEPRHARPSD